MPVDPADSPRRCPYCLTAAREAALYCRMCGRRLDTVETQPGAAENSVKGANRGLCSACGFVNVPGELFCAQCGVQLPPIASPPPSLPSRLEG